MIQALLKIGFLLCLLICFLSEINAQKYYNDTRVDKRMSIKLDLLRFIEPDMAASLAIENKFSKRWSWQLQTDYIFNSYEMLFSRNKLVDFKGYRLIPELRYYYYHKFNATDQTGYIGAQFMYKACYGKYTRLVNQVDAMGQLYKLNIDVFRNKTVISPSITIGKIIYLDPEKEHWSLDINSAFGYRIKKGEQSLALDSTGFLQYYNLNYKTIGFAGNIKICYTFYR
jgi:hypothetical protein